MKKGKVEVGKTYYGLPRGFKSIVRCEVLVIREKSAVVKIISCNNPLDDAKQIELDDKTVIPLKNLKLAKE
jgi:uncharacterized protein YkvS